MADSRESRRRSSSRLSVFTGSSLSLTATFTRDVFVACADKDEALVKSRVIQPLESREITCCYPQRDFIPGHSEYQSVVEAMETSRRTIVVLSKNFKDYKLFHAILGLSNQLIAQGRVIPVKIDEDTDLDGRFRDVVILDMMAIDETTFITRLEKAVNLEAKSPGIREDAAVSSEPYPADSTPASSETSSDISTANTDFQQVWDEHDFRHSTEIINAEDAVTEFNDLDSNDPYYKHEEGHHLKAVTKTISLHKLAHFSRSKSQVVADKALEKLQDLVSSRMGHCDPDTYLEELQKAEVIIRETINKKGQPVIIKRRMLRLKTYALIVYQLGILLDKGDIDLENKFFTAISDFSKNDFKTYANKGLIAGYTVQFAQSAAKYTQDISKRKGSSFTYVEKLIQRVEDQIEGTYKELLKSLCDITTDKKKHFSTEIFLHVLKKKVMRVKDASTIFLDVLQKVLDAILKNKNKKIDKVCRSGLLLVGTQILVYIASNHTNPGIRVQAVKGSYTNDMAGLCQLWDYEDKKWKEVASEVFDLCTPLCFRSKDEAVVRAVADRFLTETSTSREQSMAEIPYQNDPQLDQTKMLPVTIRSIKYRLHEEGQILTVPDTQTSSEAAFSINGRMSDTDVVIKFTRYSTREDLVSKELSSDDLRNEIRVVRRMNHPNVINVLAAHDGPSPPYYLITPRMEEETLIDYVIGLRKAVPTDVVVTLVDACRQITEAVIYLSTKAKVVHRDIMAANCLCRTLPNGRMHCCLTNFGLSRTMKKCGSEERQATKYVCPGNPKDPIAYRWSAPESLSQDIFTSASEVWMLACLIYEVLTLGVHPFPQCEDPRKMEDYLNDGKRTEQPSCLSKLDEKSRLYQFLWMCWSAEPADRPSPEAVREFLEKTTKRHSKGDFSHVFVSPPTLRGESIVRRSITSQAFQAGEESPFCSNQIADDALSISQPLYYDPVAPDFPKGSPIRDADEYDDTIQQPRVQRTDQAGPPAMNQPLYDRPRPRARSFPVRTPAQPLRSGIATGDADDYDDTIQQTCGYQELNMTSPYQTLETPGAESGQDRTTASAVHLRQGARPRPYRARAPSEEGESLPRGRLHTEPTRPNPRVPDPRMIQSEIFYI
ncbi:uncharacterized protein LOC118418363 [Branchiostoma floridae]|uniref:Uncharacterized protein LOC118418363 n=1 Tax=Branchiostoma floridae TaxID=7739 RepID=A0A9J7MV71_BRAFL|nr:uncharacterized protein LOC118418363 [Branchiostoma floridae]